jgi:aspartyl protease family protein
MDQNTPPEHNPFDDSDQNSSLGRGMFYAGWLIVLGLLTVVFGDWEAQQLNPNQNISSKTYNGSAEVVLQRNRWGHYVANGFINGVEVTFLLDTGATNVSVPGSIAKALNLKKGMRSRTSTANGTINVYMTSIDELQLGNIVMTNVRGSINPHMRENEVLLGMSFLKHLELVQKGDTLILRQ